PADRGSLRWAGVSAVVVDAVTGGIRDGELLLGAELPVRMGTPDWTFVVAHVIEGEAPAVGESVEVAVDAEHRHALSAGHTACHLASSHSTRRSPRRGRSRSAATRSAIPPST